jgi:hypothetical protein
MRSAAQNYEGRCCSGFSFLVISPKTFFYLQLQLGGAFSKARCWEPFWLTLHSFIVSPFRPPSYVV